MQHAYRNVPYYQKLFDRAEVRPDEIHGLADLTKIPMTSRQDIQGLPPSELCAKGVDPDQLEIVKTSGSTGEPLAIRRTKLEEWLLLAYRARMRFGFGSGLRIRYSRIHSVSDSLVTMQSKRGLHEKLGFLQYELIDCNQPTERIVAQIERFRPASVLGPPSILSWLAADLSEEDRRRMNLEVVDSGAETLTPEMRSAIAQGFGAPVRDAYGSHEVVAIALELDGFPGYRVCEDSVICEVLRDGRPVEPGEEGEAVLTALHSYAAPFIRYRQGDLVVRAADDHPGPTCSLLERIQGRTGDRFTLESGRVIPAYKFTHEMRLTSVRRFQVVQDKRNVFRIRVELRNGSSLADTEDTARRIERIVGENIQVRVEPVNRLMVSPTGKFYICVPYERIQAWGGTDPPQQPS